MSFNQSKICEGSGGRVLFNLSGKYLREGSGSRPVCGFSETVGIIGDKGQTIIAAVLLVD